MSSSPQLGGHQQSSGPPSISLDSRFAPGAGGGAVAGGNEGASTGVPDTTDTSSAISKAEDFTLLAKDRECDLIWKNERGLFYS